MKKLFVSSTAIAVLFMACKTNSNLPTMVAVPVHDTLYNTAKAKIIKDKELFVAVTEVIPVDTVYTEKDLLHLITPRIQGCEAEDFSLLWNGAMAKSLPPQVGIKLFHKVDPACKERHHFHLTYNISTLKLKADTTASTSDSSRNMATLLKIAGVKNSIRYSY